MSSIRWSISMTREGETARIDRRFLAGCLRLAIEAAIMGPPNLNVNRVEFGQEE